LACAAGRAGIANKPQPAMNTTQAANLECMGVSFDDAKFILRFRSRPPTRLVQQIGKPHNWVDHVSGFQKCPWRKAEAD
jgi:hypothetical protein